MLQVDKDIRTMLRVVDIIVQAGMGAAAIAGLFDGVAIGLIWLGCWQVGSLVFNLSVAGEQPFRKARLVWMGILGIYFGIMALAAVSIIFFVVALLMVAASGLVFTAPYFIITVTEFIYLKLQERKPAGFTGITL